MVAVDAWERDRRAWAVLAVVARIGVVVLTGSGLFVAERRRLVAGCALAVCASLVFPLGGGRAASGKATPTWRINLLPQIPKGFGESNWAL